MTLLIVPVSGEHIDDVRGQVEKAIAQGADAIELRVDLMGSLTSDDLRTLRKTTPGEVSFLLTIRSAAEGGQWDAGDDERVSRLIELGPFVDYIDVELALWRRSANIRQKIELALHRADPAYATGGEDESSFVARRKLILSRHDFHSRPSTLQKDLVEMLAEPACAAPKIAWRARSVRDNFEAFEHMRGCAKPPLLICMGEEGLLSRVLAKKFGAFGSFASLERGMETAAGQPSIEDIRKRYRWDAIDRQTEVYGVIGDPVSHSLSPQVHNAAFADAGINAVYLPMRVLPGYESFKALMVEVLARSWMDVRGFSVTIPHKENALRWLKDVGGVIDPAALRIGAVNTIVLRSDGTIHGRNTDYEAALAGIQTAVAKRSTIGAPLRAAVLGAGGVARAVVAALKQLSADVTIFNRTAERAKALAEELNCAAGDWENRQATEVDLIANCTSVGLAPDIEQTPYPADALRPGMIVFDTVYRPVETRLLRDAAGAGCTTLSGLDMFTRQAAAQFAWWAGRDAPVTIYQSDFINKLMSDDRQ